MGRLVPIGRLAALAAMLGIAAALTVGAAGAKPAKAHHARCVSGASRAKGKSAKRRAKCKKPRKTAHGHNRVAQKVGRPSSVIKPSAGGTPPASSPTTTGPAPATSGTAPTAPLRTAPTAPSGTAPAAPSGTAPGTTRPPPTAPTPTKPARTPAEEQELTEAEAAHKAAAEAVARELPGELPLPEGAVQVNTEPGLEGPAFRPATPRAGGRRALLASAGRTTRRDYVDRSARPGGRQAFDERRLQWSSRDDMVRFFLLYDRATVCDLKRGLGVRGDRRGRRRRGPARRRTSRLGFAESSLGAHPRRRLCDQRPRNGQRTLSDLRVSNHHRCRERATGDRTDRRLASPGEGFRLCPSTFLVRSCSNSDF